MIDNILQVVMFLPILLAVIIALPFKDKQNWYRDRDEY